MSIGLYTAAMVVIRQIAEKSIEYNRPTFTCFIDVRKAFDRIQSKDVIHLHWDRQIPHIIRTIESIHFANKIQAKINGELEPITVDSGIRQGKSLRLFLFNIVMDETIKQIRLCKEYKMGNKEVKIVCCVDDVILIIGNEDDLQRFLFQFNMTVKMQMIISAVKTKCMTTSKTKICSRYYYLLQNEMKK